jgi:D-alanyl-D-alanine carboxypeptidase
MDVVTVDARSGRARTHTTAAAARSSQWRWLAAGLALAFAIPFLLTDLTSVDRDLYYVAYIAGVFGFVGAWLRFGVAAPRELLTHHWRSGIVMGLAFVAVMAWIVHREPATGHPHGLEFAAAIAWRGVVYGFADGLILSAFPIVAVFTAFEGERVLERRRGKLAVGALALAVSLLFTAVYHLGYSDVRGEKLRKPLAGDAIWSVPTLATLSPLASPITHAGLHVNAVVHSYDTDTFLPPHRSSAGDARPELQAILDSLVAGRGRIAPGATGYVLDARGAWLGAAGIADVQSGEPMATDARMRLESVSKIWTGVLTHQLAEEGKLRLSDSVERWLPGLLPYGNRITVARLLTHTSGLIDNNDVAKNPDAYIADVADPAVKEQLLRVKRRLEQTPMLEFSPLLWIQLASFQPLLAEPGTLYHYSNIGFEILGLIAVRAGGGNIHSLYRERLIEPLGLRNTAYDPQGPITGEHARGYAVAPGGPLTDMTGAHAGIGAEGAVVSNAEETGRFLVALMQGKLLGPEQLERMKTSGFWSGGEPTGCGGVAYGHSGAGAAFKTNVWVSGDGRRVAVLLLNGRGNAAADARAGAAMTRLYCATAAEAAR